MLIFTRRGEHLREDFMQSTLTKTGFSEAKPIAGDINIEPKKGAITASQDGEWILFAGQFSGQGFGNFDIYKSVYTPSGWSEPENLGANINTDFWESSPSLSPDNRELYFSSNRPGGYGGKDLYVSYRGADGRWTPAKTWVHKSIQRAMNSHPSYIPTIKHCIIHRMDYRDTADPIYI